MGMGLAPIKFFKTHHDRIVLMHLQHMKNYEIAEELGITPQRVHQVLKDPAAQRQIAEFRRRLREVVHEDIEGRMLKLGPSALENIAQTIDAEIPAHHRAKKHQDDVSLKLLDRLGYTPRSDRATDGEGGLRMDRDLQERLVGALESSERIHEYDAAEEADYRLVEGSDTVTSTTGSRNGNGLVEQEREPPGDNTKIPRVPDAHEPPVASSGDVHQ